MKIDFIFQNNLERRLKRDKIKVLSDAPIEKIKALAFFGIKEILINLSADQWKYLDEDILVRMMTQTITHENIHLLIDRYPCSLEMAEQMCLYLAEQIQEGSLFLKKKDQMEKWRLLIMI